MLRRKLFAYTVAYAVGISFGYYIFEKLEFFWGFVGLLSIALSIRVIDFECRAEELDNQRIILLAILLLGFISFTLRYIDFNLPLYDADRNKLSIEEIGCIQGRLVAIKQAGEQYVLTVRPENIDNIKKVRISYYKELPIEKDIYELLGNEIAVYGSLKVPEGEANPGCFNYKLYLNSVGVRYSMSGKYFKNVEDNTSLFYSYRRSIFRLRETFLSNFDKETRAFLKGVIFGDKSELDDTTIDEFTYNSTGHILAVSGLHVGFLFALLRTLTRRKRSKLITCIIILVLILYAEMTAWSASTCRAIIVAVVSIMRIYSRRPFDLLSSVSVAALIILIVKPYQLFNSGFQMTFLALLGICFCCEVLTSYLGEALAVIISVQLVIAPMIAFNYNGLNVMSLFINIPIVFLAGILVPVSICALIILILINCLPNTLALLIEGLCDIVLKINNLFSADGYFYNSICGFNACFLIMYYVLLFFFCSEWVRIRLIREEGYKLRILKYLLVPVFCVGVICSNQFLNDEIVFVSVGQGDCTHIRAGASNIIIDGGGSEYYNIGKNTLKPYLLKNGVNNLDVALVTHAHTDHYKGVLELNSLFPIAELGIPKACMDDDLELPNNSIPIEINDRIKIDSDIYIEAIWPLENKAVSYGNANENNMIYMIHYNGIKILVTGDILDEDEKEMLEYYRGTDMLKSDILKVGHHGSKSSSSEEFLDAVSPDIAVIQVGLNNMYGHPHQQTLDRLAERGIEVYRTDQNGAVGLDIRKKSIHIDTMM